MTLVMEIVFGGGKKFVHRAEGRLPWPVSGLDGFSIENTDDNAVAFLASSDNCIALVILGGVTNRKPIVRIIADGLKLPVKSVESINICVRSAEYQQHWGWHKK